MNIKLKQYLVNYTFNRLKINEFINNMYPRPHGFQVKG